MTPDPIHYHDHERFDGAQGRVDSPPALLVVNDDPYALMALTAALEGGPWRLVTSTSGVGAFKQLLLDDFALIVLDVSMPGLDGFEVAEIIRSRPRSAATPIIFCSATQRAPDDLFKGYELGAVDYLTTPVVSRVLRSKVAVFVELYEQRRRLAGNVTELQQTRDALALQNHELLRPATRDEATGCLNRRGFELAAGPLLDQVRTGGEVGIVSVALDRSGEIFEEHPGAGCDAGVRRLARLLGAALREDDELCRWSDEQFIIALGHTALEEAAQIAQRQCDSIRGAATPQSPGNDGASPTASVGVTSTAFGATTIDALVAQASAALRSARHDGGNAVRCFAGRPAG